MRGVDSLLDLNLQARPNSHIFWYSNILRCRWEGYRDRLENAGDSLQLVIPNVPMITFGGSRYTADSLGAFVVAGQTIKSGETLTLYGISVLYAANGHAFVMGLSTQPLSLTNKYNAPAITFRGSRYTEGSVSDFVMTSQTLTPDDPLP